MNKMYSISLPEFDIILNAVPPRGIEQTQKLNMKTKLKKTKKTMGCIVIC